MAPTDEDVSAAIKKFAATISRQPMGLAHYRPHKTAVPANCIANARGVSERYGGQIRYGWYFLFKHSIEHGHYLIAVHHAVWHNPKDLSLIDVTPLHPDENQRPIALKGDTLFLVDDGAKPYITGNFIVPLPSRFFPIGDNLGVREYVLELQKKEYDSYNREHGASFS